MLTTILGKLVKTWTCILSVVSFCFKQNVLILSTSPELVQLSVSLSLLFLSLQALVLSSTLKEAPRLQRQHVQLTAPPPPLSLWQMEREGSSSLPPTRATIPRANPAPTTLSQPPGLSWCSPAPQSSWWPPLPWGTCAQGTTSDSTTQRAVWEHQEPGETDLLIDGKNSLEFFLIVRSLIDIFLV